MQTNPKLGQKLSKLAKFSSLRDTRQSLLDEQVSYLDLQGDAEQTNDADLSQECQSELARIQTQLQQVETDIVDALLPDSDDLEDDALLEIKAGTGGDEASFFAGELLETYLKSARNLNFKVELLSKGMTEGGGVSGANVQISGRGAYGTFLFESGVHRVQRVPVNDKRIQTSACSVAVLPVADESEVTVNPSDLRIDVMRASGAGGQHVNTTDSAVRVTHLPTGLTASIQDERSQHQNRSKALKLIQVRVNDHYKRIEREARGAARSSLLGGGDRSERIRTYNFPQDRVTDHRCKETKHGVSKLMDGGNEDGLVVTFLPFLRKMRREEQLKDLET